VSVVATTMCVMDLLGRQWWRRRRCSGRRSGQDGRYRIFNSLHGTFGFCRLSKHLAVFRVARFGSRDSEKTSKQQEKTLRDESVTSNRRQNIDQNAATTNSPHGYANVIDDTVLRISQCRNEKFVPKGGAVHRVVDQGHRNVATGEQSLANLFHTLLAGFGTL
jgi:hypothetical protein